MAPILFSIQSGDDRPIYRQIIEQVKSAIASGRLRPGDKLPTHRDMARDLVVAPLTVKKAYDILEGEGFISQEQGRGSFVGDVPRSARDNAQGSLHERVEALVRQARIMGLDKNDVRSLVASCWKAGTRDAAAGLPAPPQESPRVPSKARRARPIVKGAGHVLARR